MKAKTYIIANWSAEVKKVAEATKQEKAERLAKWREFKSSFCDLFDTADFEYYAEVTKLKISTLLKYAKYHDDDQGWINSFIVNESIY